MRRDRAELAAIRGVLLDKDGTVLDFQRTWVPINREVALMAAEGDACLADELLALGGQDPLTGAMTPGSVLAAGTHDDIATAFAARLGSLTPLDLGQRIERLFRDGGARHAAPVDGAATALEALARLGLVVGLATNDSAGGLAASLARADLARHFAFAIGCDDGHGAKPEPGMVHAFCRWSGLAPAAVAVVGDAVHDLEMGRRAGAGLLVGITSGTSSAGDLAAGADVLLASIRDLPALLAAPRSRKSKGAGRVADIPDRSR